MRSSPIASSTVASAVAATLALAVLAPWPANGQSRAADIRVSWGYNFGLEDTPPHGLVGGLSATVPVTDHLRVGGEVQKVNLFGPYYDHKRRALLARALVEYELLPGRRFNPYWMVGAGPTQYRTRYPVGYVYDAALDDYIPTDAFEWDVQHRFHFTGGIGLRAYVSDHIFVNPELRFGVLPLVQGTVALGVSF